MTNQTKTILQILIIFFTLIIFPKQIIAANIKVAVIYPDAAAPYANLFSTIIEGMKSHERVDLLYYKIDNTSKIDKISSWITDSKPDVLVALGQISNNFISELKLTIPVITSALTRPSSGHSCVCINSEPKQLFKMLLSLKPNIKRIFYVYNKTYGDWLIPYAKSSAKEFKIELIIKPAKSIQDAALHYKEILNGRLEPTDAIWLPVDNSILGDVIFPEILKSAWQRKFAIFSSNPFYVKRGGLFALFPDYYKLGKQISDMTTHVDNVIQVSMLHTKSAINIRTARHIGITINNQDIKRYDIVYPHK